MAAYSIRDTAEELKGLAAELRPLATDAFSQASYNAMCVRLDEYAAKLAARTNTPLVKDWEPFVLN